MGRLARRPRRGPHAARPGDGLARRHRVHPGRPSPRRELRTRGHGARLERRDRSRVARPRSARANGRSGPRRHRHRRQRGRLAYRDRRRRRQRPHLRRQDWSAAGRYPRRHCVAGGLCVVNRAVFSPDGSRIATTGSDATVRIFDAATGRQLRVLRGHEPGGFGTYPVGLESGRNPTPVDRDEDGTRIWNAHAGRQLLALPPSGGPGVVGCLEPRWHTGAHRVGDRSRVSGTRRAASDCARSRRTRRRRTSCSAATDRGSRSRPSTSARSLSRIWDWPAGVETLKLRDEWHARIAFSPDGRLLAGVRQRQPVPFVRVWALDPELLLRDRSQPRHPFVDRR